MWRLFWFSCPFWSSLLPSFSFDKQTDAVELFVRSLPSHFPFSFSSTHCLSVRQTNRSFWILRASCSAWGWDVKLRIVVTIDWCQECTSASESNRKSKSWSKSGVGRGGGADRWGGGCWREGEWRRVCCGCVSVFTSDPELSETRWPCWSKLGEWWDRESGWWGWCGTWCSSDCDLDDRVCSAPAPSCILRIIIVSNSTSWSSFQGPGTRCKAQRGWEENDDDDDNDDDDNDDEDDDDDGGGGGDDDDDELTETSFRLFIVFSDFDDEIGRQSQQWKEVLEMIIEEVTRRESLKRNTRRRRGGGWWGEGWGRWGGRAEEGRGGRVWKWEEKEEEEEKDEEREERTSSS